MHDIAAGELRQRCSSSERPRAAEARAEHVLATRYREDDAGRLDAAMAQLLARRSGRPRRSRRRRSRRRGRRRRSRRRRPARARGSPPSPRGRRPGRPTTTRLGTLPREVRRHHRHVDRRQVRREDRHRDPGLADGDEVAEQVGASASPRAAGGRVVPRSTSGRGQSRRTSDHDGERQRGEHIRRPTSMHAGIVE